MLHGSAVIVVVAFYVYCLFGFLVFSFRGEAGFDSLATFGELATFSRGSLILVALATWSSRVASGN